MPISKLHIEIDQGSRYHPVFIWRKANGDPIDLTGREAIMRIRESRDKDSNIIWEGSSLDSPSSVDLFGVSGQFRPIILATETDDFDFSWAYYDINFYVPGEEDFSVLIVGGNVKLNESVNA